jgi:inosine/xanthosine triphosphate pyrophosphatase family protein
MNHGIFSQTSMVTTHLVVDDSALVRHALGLNPFSYIVDFS